MMRQYRSTATFSVFTQPIEIFTHPCAIGPQKFFPNHYNIINAIQGNSCNQTKIIKQKIITIGVAVLCIVLFAIYIALAKKPQVFQNFITSSSAASSSSSSCFIFNIPIKNNTLHINVKGRVRQNKLF